MRRERFKSYRRVRQHKLGAELHRGKPGSKTFGFSRSVGINTPLQRAVCSPAGAVAVGRVPHSVSQMHTTHAQQMADAGESTPQARFESDGAAGYVGGARTR